MERNLDKGITVFGQPRNIKAKADLPRQYANPFDHLKAEWEIVGSELETTRCRLKIGL